MGGTSSGTGVVMSNSPSIADVMCLKTLPPEDRTDAGRKLLASLDRTRTGVPIETCDALIDALGDAAPALLETDAPAAAAASLYVRARLLTTGRGVDRTAAADAWEELLLHAAAPDPLLMLQAARALGRAERTEAAAARLRAALALRPGYSFHARAQG